MPAAAIQSPSDSVLPTPEPDPDDPIAWTLRQLSWERRLDALREAAERRKAERLRSRSIQAAGK